MRQAMLFAITAQMVFAAGTALPVRFEENRGQFESSVRFYARGVDPGISLGKDSQRIGGVRARFLGASSHLSLEGVDPLAARTNYFGARTAADVRNFSRVRYRQVYPGVDVLFYANGRELEYDFVVAPHASPAAIAMRIEGTRSLKLDSSGNLLADDLIWKRPLLYQEIDGKRVEVAGGFQLQGRDVHFQIGSYRRDLPLVIDPVVSYSTYLGKSDSEVARGVGVDGAGNTYLAGYTKSAGLPVSPTAFQAGYGGRTSSHLSGDGFIAKFSSTGSLLALTYLGGTGDDIITGLAVDSAGNSYVTGFTNSGNFPTTTGAFQTAYKGQGGNDTLRFGDAFISKLGPNLNQLVYSTYIGGFRDEIASAIAIDAAGNAYITGSTLSPDFPGVANGAQKTFGGTGGQATIESGLPFFVGGDAFICKLNPTGTQLVYATYFGGKLDEFATSIAVDAQGNAYIGGFTLSVDLPVTANAIQKTFLGREPENSFFNFGDAFVAKLNADGTAFAYATYLGGKGDDVVAAIAVDAGGNAYVTGATSSSNFPVTSGVIQTSYQGPTIAPNSERIIGDIFVSKINPSGSALVFSTFYGRSGDESATAIALDPAGNIFIGGQTRSQQLPTSTDALQKTFSGYGGIFINNDDFGDGFYMELNPTATSILYSSYLGGGRDDTIQSIAVDRSGNLYLAGGTVSTDFPVSAGAYQTAWNAGGPSGRLRPDAFLVKLSGFAAANQPVLNAITNAASGAAGVVSPGMVFVAYGVNLGPTNIQLANFENGKVSTSNSEVRILFDNQPSPVVYVLNGQVSGIVPYSLTGKSTTQIVVEYKGVRSAPITAQVVDAVPGVFSLNQSGSGQAVVFNEDSSVNGTQRPAARGSIIVLFGTGEGQTIPAGTDGLVASSVFPKPVLPATVTIGGQGAAIAYVGAVPNVTAGVFQINAVVPSNVATGDQPLVVQFGNFKSQANLTVAIQ